MSLLAERYCVDDVTMHSCDLSLSRLVVSPALPNPSGSGFGPPYDIPYGGLKLPRVGAEFRRSYLRSDADLPQVGRARRS